MIIGEWTEMVSETVSRLNKETLIYSFNYICESSVERCDKHAAALVMIYQNEIEYRKTL